MGEPCPVTNSTPAASRHGPAPEGEQPPEVPVAGSSIGASHFFTSEMEIEYEEIPDTRNLFFIAWVFCCAGSIIIFVPLAFILMPLFSGAIARVDNLAVGPYFRKPTTAAPAVVTTAAPVTASVTASATTKSTKFLVPTWTAPRRTTPAVPTNCRRATPTFSVDLSNIKSDSFKSSTLEDVDTTMVEVYCLFNISRVRRSSGEDFQPSQLPWPICPNVIYWSIGVNFSDGNILSRASKLDRYNGLYNITSIARTYRPDANVFFTIGGYPEDSGLFSLLGNGTLAQITLVQTVITLLYRLEFNGLNIHVVDDAPCEQYFKNKMAGLQSFIAELRKLVVINQSIKNFKATLMVDTNKTIAKEAIAVLKNDIDRVFVDTFKLFTYNFSASFGETEFCNRYSSFLRDFDIDMGKNSKVCYGYSSLMRTWNRRLDDGGPPLVVTQTFGYASYQDFCDLTYSVDCDYGSTSNCMQLEVKTKGREIAYAYFFTKRTLKQMYEGHCLLLDGVDFGVHPKGCSLNIPGCDVLTTFSETYKK
ncbi:hypothetical protein HPB50_001614 [Hyalomma asiaticum]|uniref:Uncharacterized protein n=1 Tax=Hyalomma asiaticum TaxID=266040 RepID=A0ACB7RY60_HYAAI|nr:hypothetical protein HPB50_001614 [Hyalomma asiaticum]